MRIERIVARNGRRVLRRLHPVGGQLRETIRRMEYLHALRLGPGAFARRDSQRAAHPFGSGRNGDRAVARTRSGRKHERRIGTQRTPRSVGGHRDAVGARRVEAQVGGSERKRHFGRSRGAGHGDGFAGSLARSGAHPDFDGRSPGHVQHPEGPVADARRRIDRHGRRGRLPIDLPRAVGHHADGIVGGVGFVESERFGFDGGIGVVRRVVTAAGGEKQQTAQKNPQNPRGGGNSADCEKRSRVVS